MDVVVFVVVVEEEAVIVRRVAGRRFDLLGVAAIGDSIAVPSNEPGDGKHCPLVGVLGPSSFSSFLLLCTSPSSSCRDIAASPLNGLANGLDGRSPVWLLICDGRRTNGLAFSGDSETTAFAGENVEVDDLVGEVVGVEARTVVAGEAEFWRRKGDCRPLLGSAKESGRDWEINVILDYPIHIIGKRKEYHFVFPCRKVLVVM